MRGKEFSRIEMLSLRRITPAYAGKSDEIMGHQIGIQDHPRVCGEKLAALDGKYKYLGSPPRMRGKVLYVPLRVVCIRITPAYAGKSVSVRFFISCL